MTHVPYNQDTLSLEVHWNTAVGYGRGRAAKAAAGPEDGLGCVGAASHPHCLVLLQDPWGSSSLARL